MIKGPRIRNLYSPQSPAPAGIISLSLSLFPCLPWDPASLLPPPLQDPASRLALAKASSLVRRQVLPHVRSTLLVDEVWRRGEGGGRLAFVYAD